MRWLDNDERRTLYTPRYDTDGRESEDLLEIDRDVDALGALMASRTMAPPLSIGIFGEWGSGKSFFMQHLRRRVEALANRAQASNRPQQDVAFYKNIIQIEFNAWHYSEGNLWASLVEHIFRNLRRNQDESEQSIGKRRAGLLTRLARHEAKLLQKQAQVAKKEADVAQAQQKVAELEQQKAEKRGELELALAEKQSLMAVFPSTVILDPKVKESARKWLTDMGFAAMGHTAFELRDAIKNAQTELMKSGGFFASLLDGKSAAPRLRTPAILLIGSLLLSSALPLFLIWVGKQEFAGLTAGLTTLTGLTGSAAAWLRRHTEWLRSQRKQSEQQLQAIEAAIEQQFQAKLKELDADIQAARSKVEKLSNQEKWKRKAQAEVQQEILVLKNEIAQLSNARLLDKFIENRTGSDDYRKHLGLVALIRRDFEELSRLMEAVNRDENTDSTLPVINRIVLYIDDLDRCSQETVVKVLQAVHLLLAFPLFVVVVGVDSRWVARCLNSTYKDLLQDETASAETPASAALTPGATAYDYLEKIFQIPIWLRPIEPLNRAHMVRGLLSRPPVDTRPALARILELKPGIQAAPPGEGGTTAPDSQALPTAPPAPKDTTSPPAPKAMNSGQLESGDLEKELNPPGLDISAQELAFIDQLGPLLSATPRVLKRFVNTYRLIKACVPSEEQDAFMGVGHPGTSPSQVCLMLLALVSDHPDVATKLFSLLERTEGDGATRTLQALVKVTPKNRDDSDLRWFRQWLYATSVEFQQTPLDLVRKLVPWVTRFSFR
ncbi:P-loop NTPase fold protein [Myxococcus faecalis]|uniref:P-loop NTPase fold protein n=1 Tax=Myxococcus faecalis TaxID=3115646 RepID=UPI0038D0FBAA